MNRTPIPHWLFAVTLALLLPLEQLHCACVGSQTSPVRTSPKPGHECCDSRSQDGAERHSQPRQAPESCSCSQFSEVRLPAVIDAGATESIATFFAVLPAHAIFAPVPVALETAAPHDAGSAPLPQAVGAHGLRAPPRSA